MSPVACKNPPKSRVVKNVPTQRVQKQISLSYCKQTWIRMKQQNPKILSCSGVWGMGGNKKNVASNFVGAKFNYFGTTYTKQLDMDMKLGTSSTPCFVPSEHTYLPYQESELIHTNQKCFLLWTKAGTMEVLLPKYATSEDVLPEVCVTRCSSCPP